MSGLKLETIQFSLFSWVLTLLLVKTSDSLNVIKAVMSLSQDGGSDGGSFLLREEITVMDKSFGTETIFHPNVQKYVQCPKFKIWNFGQIWNKKCLFEKLLAHKTRNFEVVNFAHFSQFYNAIFSSVWKLDFWHCIRLKI